MHNPMYYRGTAKFVISCQGSAQEFSCSGTLPANVSLPFDASVLEFADSGEIHNTFWIMHSRILVYPQKILVGSPDNRKTRPHEPQMPVSIGSPYTVPSGIIAITRSHLINTSGVSPPSKGSRLEEGRTQSHPFMR